MIRQLLARLRCELTDHDHETVIRRRDGVRTAINRCRRGCGWESPAR